MTPKKVVDTIINKPPPKKYGEAKARKNGKSKVGKPSTKIERWCN